MAKSLPGKYDQDFFERSEGLRRLRSVRDFPTILEFLDPKPGERILDVGCGLGRLSSPLSRYGAEVTGIDISEYAIDQAKQLFADEERLEFICMDALGMSYRGYFDKVLCYHLLEHLTLADAGMLLKKIHDALKNGGVLALGVPVNDFTLYRRVIRFLFTGKQWREPTHQISFSLQSIRDELSAARFQVTDVHPWSYFGIELPRGLLSLPVFGGMLQAGVDIRSIKVGHS